ERSWAALQAIRARMQPGISEPEAVALAHEVFAELGSERLWHRPLIRIGRNTTKGFREPSEPGVRLGENDSYFIDLGLVFDGHEGDVGDTFVVGHAPQRQACAAAPCTPSPPNAPRPWAGVSTRRSRATGSAIFRTRSTTAATSATSTACRPAACGYWRSSSPTRANPSAPSTKTCSRATA